MHKWFLALGTELVGLNYDTDRDEQKAEYDEECLQKIKPGGLNASAPANRTGQRGGGAPEEDRHS